MNNFIYATIYIVDTLEIHQHARQEPANPPNRSAKTLRLHRRFYASRQFWESIRSNLNSNEQFTAEIHYRESFTDDAIRIDSGLEGSVFGIFVAYIVVNPEDVTDLLEMDFGRINNLVSYMERNGYKLKSGTDADKMMNDLRFYKGFRYVN